MARQNRCFLKKNYFTNMNRSRYNAYYLPISLQWVLAICLFLIGIYGISLIDVWWKLIFVFLLIPILQFCCTPLFRLIGIYKYLSTTVYAVPATKAYYELHNATTYDYLQQFSWSDKGLKTQRQLLMNYGQAFLKIIQLIETGKLPPSLQIIGQSFFFSRQTAKKLGFQIYPANRVTKICSTLNALELTILYSFARGKWVIPPFWKVKVMTISGEDLCKKKELIRRIIQQIKKKG